tara:strand:- start:4191 stop:5270 length:1080 start_codon:yes stop_codon:yes gene_type:complete
MASTYSDRLKLELMATGANANTWGTNTNNNLNVLDAFAGGYLSKSVAGSADVTLTTANADPAAEASNKVVEFTGALTGDIKVFVPAVENNYIFFNNTTGSQTLSVAPTGHAGNAVAITQGAHTIMYVTNNNKVVDLFAGSLGTVGVKGAATFNDDVTVATGKKIVTENITLNSNGVVAATSYTGSGANLTDVDPFPSGTSMVFNQASAPTGWTKQTATGLSDAAMAVVTGTGGGTGGSDTFFTTFASSRNTDLTSATVSVSGTVGDTTLSTPTIASHAHAIRARFPNHPNNANQPTPTLGESYFSGQGNRTQTGTAMNNSGGGGSHSHPFSVSSSSLGGTISMPAMDVKYANVIIANKD